LLCSKPVNAFGSNPLGRAVAIARIPLQHSRRGFPRPAYYSSVTTAKSCCDPDTCIRREIATLLDPDAPILDRIYVAACAVAQSCGELTPDEVHACAARMFDVAPECELSKAFAIAYQTERDLSSVNVQRERRRADELI